MAGIFISYRREDSAHWATHLYYCLAREFGAERVFMDVDTISIGEDFVEAITRTLDSSKVMLVVIGPRWVEVTDRKGRRRLDRDDDPVAVEVVSALDRGIRVVPVLVDRVAMPTTAELPDGLARLTGRQAIEVTGTDFQRECSGLVDALTHVLEADPSPQAPPQGPDATASRGEQTGQPDL